MIPRLANRTPRTRAVRGNMGEPRLESLAAEFALLAQRRSRAIHQMEILDHQRTAAAAAFAKMQKRIAWLLERMEAFTPELHAAVASVAAPEPQNYAHNHPHNHPQTRPLKPATPAHAEALAAIGRKWVAAQPAVPDNPARPRFMKRT